jgi:hypothetical protein
MSTTTPRFNQQRKAFTAVLTHVIEEANFATNQEELSILAKRIADHGNQTLAELFRDCWLGRA